jgi:DNA-binding HxlR family transcriptional regulator
MSMAKRKENSSNFVNETFLEQRCVLNKVLALVGKRWMSEILILVEKEINRFSELKIQLPGISDNVLSDSLSKLVKTGLLQKTIHQQVPLKVEYRLSKSGKTLMKQLHGLCEWGRVNVETGLEVGV